MDQKEPMTEYGYTRLINELKDLKEVQRPYIVQEIDIARGHGDLKENAEYHAAREKQSFIESRILELSDMLSKAQIIDPSELEHDKVSFGSSIKVLNLDTDKESIFTIVGVYESMPEKGLISIKSPIARALMGKNKDDEILINLPNGECEFQILDIFYNPIKFD